LEKKQDDTERPALDNKTGPAAVVRNLSKIHTGDDGADGFRVVTIDRFYTAVQLLSMRFYAVGTIMTNRVGYCKDVINKKKKRRASDQRGSFKMARSVDVPSMIALSWLDNKPVHFLSTGATGCRSSVTRRSRTGPIESVSCPAVVNDYHRFMGGVDRHDQLRLQRYSLQTCYRFKKYYKSLFMGLVDLAVVNAFVSHVKCAKDRGNRPMTRTAFMSELQEQLIMQNASDFSNTGDISTPTSTTAVRHTIEQNNAFRVSGKQRMRRRNACKVCSIRFRKKGEKSNETSWFCVQCSEDNKRLFLCNTIRASQGNTKTCFDIWHQEWRCRIPTNTSNSIQMRPTLGKRRRQRVNRELLDDENPSDHEEDERCAVEHT